MKKKVVGLLVTVMLAAICLGGCQNGAQEDVGGAAKGEKKEQSKENGDEDELLGYEVKRTCQPPGEMAQSQYYYVNLPGDYTWDNPMSIFANSAAMDSDEYIILAQEYDSFPAVSSVEAVFPTYCAEVVDAMADHGRRNAANFNIGTSEMVEINGIQMGKHKGICTFYDEDNNKEEEKYVTYAAQLSNGAYGFFIVMGTNGAAVEADALFVANTFRETEEISEDVVKKLADITEDSVKNAEEGWGEISVWQTKDMEVPKLQALTWQELPTLCDRSTRVATTPFDFTYEELKNILQKHDVITANYDLYDYEKVTVLGDAEEGVDMVNYTIQKQILGMQKGKSYDRIYDWDCDFILSLEQNTFDYTNWNSISFTFRNLTESGENQEKIHALLMEIFGAEMAEYLIYQNNATDYEETFAYGEEAEYYLTSQRGKYGMTFAVTIDIPLTRDRLAERVYYYDGGKEPFMNSVKYNFLQLTGGLFEDYSTQSFRNYEKDYLSIGDGTYVYTDPSVSYEVMQLNATDTQYTAQLELLVQKQDWIARNCPVHVIDAEVVEDAAGIKSILVEYEVENEWDDKPAFETVADHNLSQVRHLFPNADLSAATYDALKNDDVTIELGTTNILGMDCKCRATLDDSKDWKLQISYSRE